MQQTTSASPAPPSQSTLWLIGCGFLGAMLLGTLLESDLPLSRHFYDPTAPQRWVYKYSPPWSWLYTYGEWPSGLLALAAAFIWLGSRWRSGWRPYRYACATLVLAVVLGPGLLVNGIVKPLWGRPRPQHTEMFGGGKPYRQWWQAGPIGEGRSFPSGHAAMGYILVVGVGCLAPKRPRWQHWLVLGGALSYGSLLGMTRIVQGGHFLSDVLWSGAFMCFTAATLHQLLGRWCLARTPVEQEVLRALPTPPHAG